MVAARRKDHSDMRDLFIGMFIGGMASFYLTFVFMFVTQEQAWRNAAYMAAFCVIVSLVGLVVASP